jgi:hypothetical protein
VEVTYIDKKKGESTMGIYDSISNNLPGLLGTANSAVGKMGNYLNRPNMLPAMASIGQLLTGMGGKGLPANDIATLASGLAAGPVVEKAAGGVPPNATQQGSRIAALGGLGQGLGQQAMPQAPVAVGPQVGRPLVPNSPQPNPNQDLNQNGVPDALEIKIKMPSRIASELGSSGVNSLVGSLANFQGGAGANAGTPTSAVQVPALQPQAPIHQAPIQQAPAYDENRAILDNSMFGSAMLGPAGYAELVKHRMTSGTNQMKAQADYIKAIADRDKLAWESSPQYIQFQGALKYAQTVGDKQAELEAKEVIWQQADKIPILEPRLRNMGFPNYGKLMRVMGSTDITSALNAAMRATAEIDAALINAQSRLGAANIQGAALYKSVLIPLYTQNLKAIKDMQKFEIPLPPEHKDFIAQKNRFTLGTAIKATEQDMADKQAMQNQNVIIRQILGDAIPGDSALTASAGQSSNNETGFAARGDVTLKVRDKEYTIPKGSSWRVKNGKVQVKKGR